MDVLTSETWWALNNEIIKQVTSSWSLFIKLSRWCTVQYTYNTLNSCYLNKHNGDDAPQKKKALKFFPPNFVNGLAIEYTPWRCRYVYQWQQTEVHISGITSYIYVVPIIPTVRTPFKYHQLVTKVPIVISADCRRRTSKVDISSVTTASHSIIVLIAIIQFNGIRCYVR